MLGYHWPSALEETVLPFFCGLFNPHRIGRAWLCRLRRTLSLSFRTESAE
jgi:hypothetical protein